MNNSLLSRLLIRWVRFVEAHSNITLMSLVALTFAAGTIALFFGAINSDLSKLVKPSDDLQWHQDNENYKQAFPLLQQTAVVVVSGADAKHVETVARSIESKLLREPIFSDVFAPAIDDYISRHVLYFPSTPDLQRWAEGARYNYGSLLRLADAAGLGNAVFTFADQASSLRGGPLPLPLATLADGFSGEIDDHEITLDAFYRLVDPEAEKHYQLIVVKGLQQHDKGLPNKQIVETLKNTTASEPFVDGVSVRHTGELVLADEELTAAMTGIGYAGTVSLILLAIILGFGVRSIAVIAAIFGLLLLGVILTTGFATVAVGSYNALSLIFVVMFFGLGVDFAVHFVLRMREAAQLSKNNASQALLNTYEKAPHKDSAKVPSEDTQTAAQIAIADIGPALLLCTLTSMIAFLSFAPTAYRGLAELGIISAGGMAIACILTLTLLPALGRMLTREQSVRAARIPNDIQTQQTDNSLHTRGFNPFSATNPKIVLAVTCVATLVALYFAQNIRFDYSVLAMRDTNTEGMATLIDLQKNHQVTDYSISVLADDQTIAAELKIELQKLDEVGDVDTPLDFVPTDQAAKQEILRELYVLYSTLEEVLAEQDSQIVLGEAMLYLDEVVQSTVPALASDERALLRHMQKLSVYLEHVDKLETRNNELQLRLKAELDRLMSMLVAEPITLQALPEMLRARMISNQGQYLMTVHPAEPLLTRQQTQQFIEAVQKVAPNIAGRSVVEWGVGDVVVESFIQAGTIALLLIFVLLVTYFRNLHLPIMVLIPIVLSVVFTFAICEIAGVSLNMANILVVPLIIGLGVDTGIHVVHRYTHSNSVADAYASSTSRAVVISALTTIGTFVSLSFSPHKGAASVGLLLTISISALVVMTFTVLPALMRVWDIRASNALQRR
jgi:predicted RND superfamily exporter protein